MSCLLVKLGCLNLSHKNLFCINEDFLKENQDFLHTITADFSSNYFPTAPGELRLFPFLEHLSFSKNLIKTTSTLPHLQFLAVLDLSFNNLTLIEPNICKLTNLKSLNFNDNQLTSIPHQISDLKHLEEFYVAGNNISIIPENVCHLYDLKIFDISRNILKAVTRSISDLQNLMVLDLSFNNISVFDAPLHRIRTLIHLNIDKNPLVYPPYNVTSLGVNAILNYLSTSDPRSNKTTPTLLLSVQSQPANISRRVSPMNMTVKSPATSESNIQSKSSRNSPVSLHTTSVGSSPSIRSKSPRSLYTSKCEKRSLEEIKRILVHRLGVSLPINVDFYEYISDGVILARLIKKFDKNSTFNIFIPTSPDIPLKPNQKTHNINMFVRFCENNLRSVKNLCTCEQILCGRYHIDIEETLSSFFDKYC